MGHRMKECPREDSVLQAFHDGQPLPDHVRDCEWCAAALLLAQTLQADAADVTVPSHGLVYWKARLRERRQQQELALRPARRMEWMAAALVLATPVIVAAATGMVLVAVAAAGLGIMAAATIAVLKYRLQ